VTTTFDHLQDRAPFAAGRGHIAPAEAAASSETATRRERWPWALAALSLVVYITAAWWLIYRRGYEINDAISRTSMADHVVLSRDPHLGAMGWYWMPLPQISQIPMVFATYLFHQVRFAGPLTSALWAAAVIPVLASIARSLGVPKKFAVIGCGLYAFSPIAVFSAANGMSEASSFFFLAVTMLGYTRWDRLRKESALVLMSIGLAGMMLCRYETLGLAPALALLCALQAPRIQRKRAFVIVILPTAYVFTLWLWASSIITNDAFYWYKQTRLIGAGSVGQIPAILGQHYSGVAPVVRFVLIMMLLFAGVVLAMAPLCLVRDRHRLLSFLGYLGPPLTFGFLVLAQLLAHTTSAGVRYFYPSWLLGVILAFAVIGDRHRLPRQGAVRGVRWYGIAAIGMCIPLQLSGFLNLRIASAEFESVLFAPLLGKTPPSPPNGAWDSTVVPWQQLFHYVDPQLAAGASLMLDTESSSQAVLFTRHPRQLIIPEDRDFEQILAAPYGHVDFIAIPEGSFARISRYIVAMRAVAASPGPQGGYARVASYGPLTLYKYSTGPPSVPAPGATTIERQQPSNTTTVASTAP